jgi:Tol biopolymer transport system component
MLGPKLTCWLVGARHAAPPPWARVPSPWRPYTLFLALALLLLPAPASGAPTALPTGLMVAPRSSGLVMIDAATGVELPVGVVPPVGVAGHAAWSPDGTRVALSRFGRRPGERIGGSDILVVGAAGGEGVPIVEHDAEGALLGVPAWARDGSGLFFDYLPPNGDTTGSRVEFATLDGSVRRVIAQPGAWPSVTVDGQSLLYVRPGSQTGYLDELVLLPLDGGPERVLVPAGQFVQIVSPRQSPDGRQVAFVGSLTVGEARLPMDEAAGPLNLTVMAHGPPGDIWVLSPDGSPPWQRTAFEEDEPTIAWSPDGVWLAMLSGGGLYMVDVEGWRPSRRIGHGGFGGIDWR